MTPLFKQLKKNGTSFYSFPGAAEDISASRNNENYKMYFSNFSLLNFPKQNLDGGGGTYSKPTYFDFDNFYRVTNTGQQATSYQDQLVESLRNYVANQEETIRESKINNTEYFYDNTSLNTTSERIFWKWCKRLNLMDFEVATDGDQYFGNLTEFESNNQNDTTYFPEILWRERLIKEYSIISLYQSDSVYNTNLEIEFDSTKTTLKVGDIIKFSSFLEGSQFNGYQLKILLLIESDGTSNQKAVLDYTFTNSEILETKGNVKLVYNKLVQFIGEVNGVSNVQTKNRSYTEVVAQIPDHVGSTPDILFRTKYDVNYKPSMTYPILPLQYQSEIIGAELFNSPIVNTPQNYPGNFYGQFDTQYEYTYKTADGDYLRRSGDYYGINGDINDPVVDGSTIDGISLDFNPTHYVKMNVINREMTSFTQFSGLEVDNEPPSDFEYNAILWYYTVEDSNGNTATNLYGISFIDNPDNNVVEEEVGLRLPVHKKLAANDKQDGTSYVYSINLNYNIISDNVQDSYNPDAINSIMSFNLYDEAMRRLSSVSDSFQEIILEHNEILTKINDIKQLVYTQTDFININNKISKLEKLLKLYSTNQLISSDSIDVVSNSSGLTNSIPTISLYNKDTQYGSILNVLTTDLYNSYGNIPMSLPVVKNRNILLNIINDDETYQLLNNNQKLVIYLSNDLSYKQSIDIFIDANENATQNKKLEFYINYNNSSTSIQTNVFTTDLPIHYNTVYQTPNISKTSQSFNFNIDFTQDMKLDNSGLLTIGIEGKNTLFANVVTNTLKKGDVVVLNDFLVGTSSTVDFSGQYSIKNINSDNANLNIELDSSTNPFVTSYVSSHTNLYIHDVNNNVTLLSKMPFINLNKGVKYKITRVSDDDTSSFNDRYLVQKL